MSQIPVKCYLLGSKKPLNKKSLDKVKEIRRFNIDACNAYESLVEKVLAHFKDELSSRDHFKIYWLDDEEEFIGFSSQSELQYALDLQSALQLSNGASAQSAVKIYVAKVKEDKEEAGEASPSENPFDAIHPGIVCDGCENAIFGDRYKCTTCADFDLCAKCEQKKVHKESGHTFLKITMPSFFKPGRCPRKRPHQAHFWPHFKPDTDQFKRLGESFKAFLDPFGIDVDYYVDNWNKKRNEGDVKKEDVQMNDVETKAEEKTAEEQKPRTEEQKPAATEASEASNAPSAPVLNSLIMNSSNLMSFDNISNAEQKKSEEIRASDIDLSSFNMVDMEKETQIIKTIEQLKMMGYSDESGFLTRLVSAKEGNLNAVLDALNF